MSGALEAALTAMSGPFAWGRCDCCIGACDAFADLHGVDPMAHLRGEYRDRPSALRIIRAAGGFRALARDCAARAGLVPGDGAPGEIGVVRLASGSLALGIGLGRGHWVAKASEGLTSNIEPVEGWKCLQR